MTGDSGRARLSRACWPGKSPTDRIGRAIDAFIDDADNNILALESIRPGTIDGQSRTDGVQIDSRAEGSAVDAGGGCCIVEQNQFVVGPDEDVGPLPQLGDPAFVHGGGNDRRSSTKRSGCGGRFQSAAGLRSSGGFQSSGVQLLQGIAVESRHGCRMEQHRHRSYGWVERDPAWPDGRKHLICLTVEFTGRLKRRSVNFKGIHDIADHFNKDLTCHGNLLPFACTINCRRLTSGARAMRSAALRSEKISDVQGYYDAISG